MQRTENKSFLYSISVRWIICTIGLWAAAGLLGNSVSFGTQFGTLVIAGLILAVINAIIKPVLVLLSLPAILISLGLFMLVINGLTVYIASRLYHPLHITNFGAAILTGIIIGVVNYLVTAILEDRKV